MKRPRIHSCDDYIRIDTWAMSGHRQTGDKWTCKWCNKRYVFQEDEAEGGGWHLVKARAALAESEGER